MVSIFVPLEYHNPKCVVPFNLSKQSFWNVGSTSLKLSLRRLNGSRLRGFVKVLTMWFSYETFLVEMSPNENFYQGNDDEFQYF
jgi:hypothetical protein